MALDIDPMVGLAHFALGSIHRFRWRGAEALAAHQRALELSPNDFDILDDFARLSSFLGRHEEALALAHRTAELGEASALLGLTYWLAGQHDAAATAYQGTQGGSSVLVVLLELSRGNEPAARTALLLLEDRLQYVPVQFETYVLGVLSYAHGRLGNREAALLYAAELNTALLERQTDDLGAQVMSFLGVDDEAQALDRLNAIASDRPVTTGAFEMLLVHNALGDPVLEQPEFVEVRSRIGFTDL
jgi:tetratricopeptide (TPR) repeat protein